MKKIIAIVLLLFCSICMGQTFQVGTLQVQSTTNASSPSTGAATVAGGLGVGNNIYAGGTIFGAVQASTLSASGTVSGTGFTNLLAPYAPLASPSLIGTPVAPLAAHGTNTNQLATASFVQQEGYHYSQAGGSNFTTNTTLSASSMGGWGIVTVAPVTVTLPTLASTQLGQSFTFIPSPVPFTVAGNGVDAINSGGSLANTQIFSPNETVTVTNNGAAWYVSTDGITSRAPGCLSIMAFGGNRGGSVDNSAALTATLAAQSTGQACVYFPPGNYAFSSAYIYTMPTNTASVTFMGAGQDVSVLSWAGGGGLSINFITDANSAHVRDLSITTGTTNTGNGLVLFQTAANTSFSYNAIMSDVTNVTIRGSDGYLVTDYWANGIDDFGISNVNFIGVNIAGASARGGNGININGDANRVPVQFNVMACNLSGLNVGFVYGAYVQGVSITSSNLTNDNTGLLASGTALDQLTVSGSQFNDVNFDIHLASPVLQTMIYGNLFLLQTSANGIYLDPSSSTSIVGNSFAPNPGATGTNGITFNSFNALSSIVTGNNFAQLTTGVNITSGAHNVNVQSNAYSGNTNTVVNNCAGGCTVAGGSQ